MATLIDKNQLNLPDDLPEVELPQSGALPQTSGPLRIDVTKEATGGDSLPEPVSSPSLVNGVNIQKALNMGYSTSEVQQYIQSQGISEDDANLAVTSTVSEGVKKAREIGYSDEEINKYLLDSGYDTNVATSAIKAANISNKFTKLDYKPEEAVQSEEDKAMDLADLYKNIHYEYATLGKQVVGILDEETSISARRDVNRLNANLVAKLQKEGIDAFLGEDYTVMMKDKAGKVSEVDSSFLGGLFNSKGELAGAIGGGIAGVRAGAIAGASVGAVFPPAAPIATGAGAVIGGFVGSAVGAMGGRAADLYVNSKKLSEDLTTSLYMTQIKQAGIADITFGVIGSSAIKMTAKSWRGLVKGYKYLTHGNPKGAYKALKDNLNLTDDQIKEMISKWEKFNNTSAPGSTFEEQAISIVTQTGKGAESSVKSAAMMSERVATIAKQSIDERAKSLIKAVDNVADENVGNYIRKDIKAYEDDVKNFYDVIKKQGADAVDGTDFRFDIEKIAIEPVMKHIESKLSNPLARERFLGYSGRIASASSDRTFSGLLELRSAVNDFKYSKSLSVPDMEALNQVLNRIDTTIDKAVKAYMPDGKQWSKNFQLAKSEYSKMKVLAESAKTRAIYKLLSNSGVTEEGIQRAISKYSNNKDVDSEVFNAIVSRLSPATKAKVEGAAIKNLLNKHTFGSSTEYQAIDFPQLAADLRGLNLSTPEAKNLSTVIDEIAKVYRNDANLASLNGKSIADQANSLSTDLLQKVKVGVVGQVWNNIYKYFPLKGSRNIALIHQVEKLLQNPLHARTAEEVLKGMPTPQQPQMNSLIKQLQIQQAKTGPVAPQAFTKMYKQSANGKLAVTDGALGKGIYLVDKIKTPNSEMKVISHNVNNTKIFDGSNLDTKAFRTDSAARQQLIDQGYDGVRVGDKVMLFPETQAGYKTPKANLFKDESGNISDTLSSDIAKESSKATGKQSLLGNPNFANWFGKSKVVDKEGKPLIVYHGTNKDFTAFDSNVKHKMDDGFVGHGIYFTDSTSHADMYANLTAFDLKDTGETGAHIMPVYLSLKNPKYLSIEEGDNIANLIQEGMISAKKYSSSLRLQGYDGVIWEQPSGAKEYVIFNSKQVKSAVGNKGLYSTITNDITGSVSEDVAKTSAKGVAKQNFKNERVK